MTISNYTNLTFTELVDKIEVSRFFNLPKMVAETFRKLAAKDQKPYKVYTALLSQTGTDAPVATVLENTLGEISFEYFSEGYYKVVSSELFSNNQSFAYTHNNFSDGGTDAQIFVGTESIYYIQSFDNTNTLTDEILNKTPIEIRVYN